MGRTFDLTSDSPSLRRNIRREQEGLWSYLPLFLQMLREGNARAGTEAGDRFDKLLRVSSVVGLDLERRGGVRRIWRAFLKLE